MTVLVDERLLDDFQECVVDLISRTATEHQPAFMTYEERFWLLGSVLLGTPAIRGGGRPRDFPMGRARATAIRLTRLLRGCSGVWVGAGQRPNIKDGNAFDTVLAFQLIVLSPKLPWEMEPRSHKFWRIVIQRLLKIAVYSVALHGQSTLGLKEVGSELYSIRGSARYKLDVTRWLRRCYDVLALNSSESDVGKLDMTLPGQGQANEFRVLPAAAWLSGALARWVPEHPGGTFEVAGTPMTNAVEALKAIPIHLSQSKTRKVQGFLAQGRQLSIVRGLSAWSMRSSALLRERQIAERGRSFVVGDSDALVQVAHHWKPPVEKYAERLFEDLRESSVADSLPLIGTFPEIHCTLMREPEALYPPVYASVCTWNMYDFCTQREVYYEDREEEERAARDLLTANLIQGRRRGPNECWGLAGMVASKDREGQFLKMPWRARARTGEVYCGRAMLYSLAGKSWRQLTSEGLRDRLAERCELRRPCDEGGHPRITARSYAKERMKALSRAFGGNTWMLEDGAPVDHVLVRLDGTRVGSAFVGTAPLSRPGLGCALEGILIDMLLDSLTELLVGMYRDAGIKEWMVPLDQLYLGGDDLQMIVPTPLLVPWVECLRVATQRRPSDAGWEDLSWKLTGVQFPQPPPGTETLFEAPRKAHAHVDTLMEVLRKERETWLPASEDHWQRRPVRGLGDYPDNLTPWTAPLPNERFRTLFLLDEKTVTDPFRP